MMKIENLNLTKPLVLAPMEEITDIPFRLMSRQRGADLVVTEFTSCEALIREIPEAFRKIAITDEERPVAVQVFGGNEESMTRAAALIVERVRPEMIDINGGCWNKNHALRGEGAGLLCDLPRMERIIKAVVREVPIPVTVKTRLGWDTKNISICDVAKMVEQAGAAALTVHCRTRCQGYKGTADWAWLDRIKKVISIPLIGNGDAKSPQDVKEMFATGCDGVMIGRAALANPWIFEQTKSYLETGHVPLAPALPARVEACITHLRLNVQVRGLGEGIMRFRKYYAGYFRDLPHAAKLRMELMALKDLDAIVDRLRDFSARHTIEPCPHH